MGSVLVLSLLGGIWLQPKLKDLQQVKYAEHYRRAATPQQREAAMKSFSTWHGVSQAMNLLMMLSLWVYLSRVIHTGEAPRFVSPINKFGLDNRS